MAARLGIVLRVQMQSSIMSIARRSQWEASTADGKLYSLCLPLARRSGAQVQPDLQRSPEKGVNWTKEMDSIAMKG